MWQILGKFWIQGIILGELSIYFQYNFEKVPCLNISFPKMANSTGKSMTSYYLHLPLHYHTTPYKIIDKLWIVATKFEMHGE